MKESCPHCGDTLTPFRVPENPLGPTGWENDIHWACFNNDCPYYQEGWDWMWESYEVKASYRYRITGVENASPKPVPVSSEDALRDYIVDESDISN